MLHAPGSLCTYEPQKASDVFAMYQSLVGNQIVPEELLWKNCPKDRQGDIDWLMELIDWDKNLDPDFGVKSFMRPEPMRPVGRDGGRGIRREMGVLPLRGVQRHGAHRPARTRR